MEQREKLIELLAKSSAPYCVFCDALGSEECKECSEYHKLVMIEKQADYLLANGVVVLPCRCGECKHWGKHDDVDVAGETDKIKACEYAIWMVGENGYCVYGERKDGDE